MHRFIITSITTIALLTSVSNSQAVGSVPNHARPNGRSPHRVFRRAVVSKIGSEAPRAQTVKAPGASASTADQAAAGGNSNPLLNQKKENSAQ